MQNYCIGFIIFAKSFEAPQKRGLKRAFLPNGKIGGDCGNFVRYAVVGNGAYSAYVSIHTASKVQKESIGTIYGAMKQ